MKKPKINWKKRWEESEALRGVEVSRHTDTRYKLDLLIDDSTREKLRLVGLMNELQQATSLYMMSRAQLAITAGKVQAEVAKHGPMSTPKVY